ncbi:MAG: 5-formyltetrahydrofolate cyclo-ligase [Ferruginibacter sp.]|nr:5-formyltetrahydrofolate cyclo-ligase [Ferruginibacter sp.]
MKKDQLRTKYKEKRMALTASSRNRLEDLLLIQFQKLDIEIPAMIMTYAPIAKFNEFDPQLITDYCFFKNPQQTLFYPVLQAETNTLQSVVVNDNTVFSTNQFGIDEPVDGLDMFPQEIDLVIVPLLAFDEKGNRVGYGKGYYDRFLKTCRKDVLKIGFSFFEAEKKITDTDTHDVKLNYCVTPEKIYEF